MREGAAEQNNGEVVANVGKTQVATAGVAPGVGRAGAEARRARKLLHQCSGRRPKAMIAAWLATKNISHLKAASMKP